MPNRKHAASVHVAVSTLLEARGSEPEAVSTRQTARDKARAKEYEPATSATTYRIRMTVMSPQGLVIMSWELVQDRSQPSTMSAVLHLGTNSAGGAGPGDGQEQSSDATGAAANTLRFSLESGFKLIVDTSHRQQ